MKHAGSVMAGLLVLACGPEPVPTPAAAPPPVEEKQVGLGAQSRLPPPVSSFAALEVGDTRQGELPPGAVHHYPFELEAGDAFRVEVVRLRPTNHRIRA